MWHTAGRPGGCGGVVQVGPVADHLLGVGRAHLEVARERLGISVRAARARGRVRVRVRVRARVRVS